MGHYVITAREMCCHPLYNVNPVH